MPRQATVDSALKSSKSIPAPTMKKQVMGQNDPLCGAEQEDHDESMHEDHDESTMHEDDDVSMEEAVEEELQADEEPSKSPYGSQPSTFRTNCA